MNNTIHISLYALSASAAILSLLAFSVLNFTNRRKPTKEEKVDRCLKWLKIARGTLVGAEAVTLARVCASGFLIHLDEVVADLKRLEENVDDSDLYNLIETKVGNLKFQYGRCLLVMDQTHITLVMFDIMDHLAQAMLSIHSD